MLLHPRGRKYFGRFIPQPFYGLFFCLITCVSLLLVFAFWQGHTHRFWSFTGWRGRIVWGAFLASWAGMFYSMHLMGLGYQTGWTPWWYWRITAHVSAVNPLNYGRILDAARARVQPLIASSNGRLSQTVRASYTGIMPLVEAIQHRLMTDLVQSFLMAFATITLVMMLLQGGFFMGLLAMVPNLFPALLLLGGFAWAGITKDIGSVVTISLGLGIAVDDTLHFLVNFRRERDRGHSTAEAIATTYRHCGSAMLQSSVTCGLGLWIFAASEFLPTCRFAWMMLAFLSLALLGDLIVLPALLLSPLGRCFGPAKTYSSKETEIGSVEEPE